MSDDRLTTICPWCSTEIVWDEELGPEEQCPHCLNELTNYRSVSLFDSEEDEAEDEGDARATIHAHSRQASDGDDEELYTMSNYEAVARHLLDRQDVFSECPACGEDMLHIGELEGGRVVKPSSALAEWPEPLLGGKLQVDAFVCPSCFRVETKLTDESRMKFVRQLTKQLDE
ncbi:hypothetical protein [Paenibacillus koleovorans]|uniref:hypothetical protein n=1 Tax=Paenibacillus koleovorans TaxID=121608 RepID=UPI000FDC67DA|nr:hypothetical protein [Paenibacillus koleovorans]